MCAFSKFVELIPLKDTTAETVAEALVGTFYRYGIPNELISDNGVQYRSKVLKEINEILGVKHIFISAYHPQANSNAERMCAVVKNMITTSLNRSQREWNQFLGATQHAINSAYQTSNKFSPAFLMFGRHFQLPIEKTLSDKPSSFSGELEDMVTILRERQADAITQVISNQKDARERQRDWYNRRAREKGFEVGDLVHLFTPSTKLGNSRKLTAKWLPGYVVERKLSNGLTYEVRKPGSHKPAEKVHVNRLKPCPQSQVYRTAQRAGHVLGTSRALHSPQVRDREIGRGEADDGDADGETDWDESISFPASLRFFDRAGDRGTTARTRQSSGVTTVLEAVATEALFSDEDLTPPAGPQPHETSDLSSSDEPVQSRTQRPQRSRRPPQRYSP